MKKQEKEKAIEMQVQWIMWILEILRDFGIGIIYFIAIGFIIYVLTLVR